MIGRVIRAQMEMKKQNEAPKPPVTASVIAVIIGLFSFVQELSAQTRAASAASYIERGVKFHRQGNLDRAFADYDTALRLKPGLAKVFYNRGNLRFMQSDLDGALADFNEAIRYDRRYAKAYNNRGITRQERGDLGGAISDFGRAIAVNSRHAEAYANRGIALLIMGRQTEAQRDLSKSLDLKPALRGYIQRRSAANLTP